MKTTKISVIAGLAIGVLTSGATMTVHAQEAKEECSLRIATGPASGVYTQLARDIQKVCGKAASVCQVPSTGGLQNLMLLSASEADIGFVQVDVLQQMAKEGDQNIQELQAVMPMHANLLHVITKTDGSVVGANKWNPMSGEQLVYRKFSDLKGAKVATVGSAQALGQALERQLGYGMGFVLANTDDEAIKMLQSNQVQAVFTTGGWPYPSVSRHASTSGLMLAEYDLSPQTPLTTTKRNYTNLGAYNYRFLSAPNLLVTRPFKPTGEKGKQVAALQNCIASHMDELQEGQYHAAWKEVRNVGDTLGITRYGKSDVTKATVRTATR
jgi:TRAP-type uncharacterized transport system substrate-binding protein